MDFAYNNNNDSYTIGISDFNISTGIMLMTAHPFPMLLLYVVGYVFLFLETKSPNGRDTETRGAPSQALLPPVGGLEEGAGDGAGDHGFQLVLLLVHCERDETVGERVDGGDGGQSVAEAGSPLQRVVHDLGPTKFTRKVG